MRAHLSGLYLFGLFAACGCNFTHRPVVPRVATDAMHEVELTRLQRGANSLVVRVRYGRWPEGKRLVAAALVSTTLKGCTGGIWAQGLTDAATGQSITEPLASGDAVDLFFHAGMPTLTGGPTRIDLLAVDELGVQTCIELPLVQRGAAYAWQTEERWTLSIDVGGEAVIDHLGGVQGLILFPVRVGSYVGPMHLSVDALIGGATCGQEDCEPMGEMQQANETLAWGGGVTAQGDFVHLGFVGLGLGGRYRLIRTGADTRDGSHDVTLHQFAAVPSITMAEPTQYTPGLVSRQQDGPSVGIELPVGYALRAGGGSSPTFGGVLVLRMLF